MDLGELLMRIGPQRPVNPEAIVAPQGYRVEALITGLTFPSAISFGTGGELYLAESGGAAGAIVAVPRVLRVDTDRTVTEIGRLDSPIVGLVYRQGELLIGEDGPAPRILRVTAAGEVLVLVDGLPGGGDYGLSGLSLDPSGALLFGVGTRTNSGVVGLDNVARGWVDRHPGWADIPGQDLALDGVNYVTSQPAPGGIARYTTGGFKPYGQRSGAGEAVRGAARCGGAVYRLRADASEAERLAWGLRYPVGIQSGPDGRIFATEGGMEERGSRPIAGAPDNLWEIRPDGYYGWPDHASGLPVKDPRFRLPGHPPPPPLLKESPKVAGTPLATFAPRSGIGRFDFSSSAGFGFVGEALVALSGEWSAAAYPGEDVAPNGYRVVRVDPRTGQTTDFLVNRQAAPASAGNTGGLERPFDVAFDPTGEVLYVVDFGEIRLNREYGLEPFGGTGVVWRITRIRPTIPAPQVRPTTEREARPAEQPQEARPEEPTEEAVEEPGGEPVDVDFAPLAEEAEPPPGDEANGADLREEAAEEAEPGIEPSAEPPAEEPAGAAPAAEAPPEVEEPEGTPPAAGREGAGVADASGQPARDVAEAVDQGPGPEPESAPSAVEGSMPAQPEPETGEEATAEPADPSAEVNDVNE
jgi:glucose/arabinose dehydrogenase